MYSPRRPASGTPVLPAAGVGLLTRSLLALALLVGFYLLVLVIVGGLIAVDVLLALHTADPVSLGALKVYGLSAVIGYPVLRTVFLTRRHQSDAESSDGLTVTPAEQPALWARVRELARESGTRGPDEMRLIADVNAQVGEESRLLGLLPGRRRLEIGVPLLIGLSQAELDAVIAHELGHFGNRDTRLGGLAYAGQKAVLHTVEGLQERAGRARAARAAEIEAVAAERRAKGKRVRGAKASGGIDQVLARIFAAYARLYLGVTHTVCRRQELAADLAAVRLVGRDATASALRRLPVLDAVVDHYLHCYATMGWEDGLLPLPGQVYGGLARLLAEPARQDELAELARELPVRKLYRYDSHPPLADRVAAIEALPPDGRPAAFAGPALGLLADPDRTIALVEAATLRPEAGAMRRLDWPELAEQTGRARYADGVAMLRQAVGAELPADALLAELTAGRVWEVADRLPRSKQAQVATGRAAREFTREVLRGALSDLVLIALVDAGLAGWPFSWAASPQLWMPQAVSQGLPAALDALVSDVPDGQPLRTLLATAGLRLPLPAEFPSS